MTVELDRFTHQHWEQLLENIDMEIARQAAFCHVQLADPGVAERVIDKDESVCGQSNPAAFQTLRGLLVMHFSARQHIEHNLSPEQVSAISEHIRSHLGSRIVQQIAVLLPAGTGHAP